MSHFLLGEWERKEKKLKVEIVLYNKMSFAPPVQIIFRTIGCTERNQLPAPAS